jgi:large subunit ribosomal protein L3
VPEPRTIEDLHTTGYNNLALTKKNGLDYERVTKSKEFGIKNKMDTFKSFEEEINA